MCIAVVAPGFKAMDFNQGLDITQRIAFASVTVLDIEVLHLFGKVSSVRVSMM